MYVSSGDGKMKQEFATPNCRTPVAGQTQRRIGVIFQIVTCGDRSASIH